MSPTQCSTGMCIKSGIDGCLKKCIGMLHGTELPIYSLCCIVMPTTLLLDDFDSAYKSGRADSDPSVNWYRGEIGFFDFYVIPLAKKLESCGVFGVSSHEFLNYAKANREEWVREGEQIVQEYIKKFDATNISTEGR